MLNKALLTNVLSYLSDDSVIISKVCHYWNNLSDGLESYQMKTEFRLKKSKSIVKSEVAQLYALKSLREDREKKGGSSSSGSDIILSASSSNDKADATNTSVTNATTNTTTATSSSSSSFTSTHNTGGLIMSSFQSSHSDGDSDISIDEDDSKYCDLFSFSSNHINNKNNNNNDDNKSMKVSKLNKGQQLQNKASSTSKQNEVDLKKTQGQKKSSSVTISYDDILPQIVISPTTTTTTTTVTKKQKKAKITTNAATTTTATTTIANIINDNNKKDDIKNDVSVNVNIVDIVDGNNDQHKDDVTHNTTTTTTTPTTTTTMLATMNTDVGGNTSTASIHTSKADTATSSTKNKTGSKDRNKLGMTICIDT